MINRKEQLALNYYFFTVLIVFSSLAISPIYSQNSIAQISALTEYANAVYGSDDALVNGRAYIPDHYNAKGNPYFLTDQWIEGTISKEGRKYAHLDLLLNIEKDHLILMTTLKNDNKIMLVPDDESIESFTLGSHFFINAATIKQQDELSGFVEEVYSGGFRVVIKYQKAFVGEYTNNNPRGDYTKTKSSIYLLADGQLFKLFTKQSLFEYFSAYKKEIRSFMRKNNIKYKRADSKQLGQLFAYCNQLSF